jgi:hypothetical protein
MKKWYLIEISMFIIMTVLVVYYGMVKTVIVYLLVCESLSSINRIMERHLKKLKDVNKLLEDILKKV